LIKKTGNIWDTEHKAVGHGVNTKGVMGAGIAVQFKNRFPGNYAEYKNWCDSGSLRPGQCLNIGEGEYEIFNMASQEMPGSDATYSWLFHSASDAAMQARIHGIKVIAIPMIGAGIGGLEWDKAEIILRAVEVLNPGFQFEVWKYEP
jgi:O-acetyl-ADP-ribose deacetylase (regulator of RNase III)